MTTEQPEALSLADWLDAVGNGGISTTKAAAELLRQHTRIAELEAQLEAIGAGGVEPLRKISEQPAQTGDAVATQWLAEMVMYDCGCSTRNQRLLERIIDRIQQYDRANTAPQPVAREPQWSPASTPPKESDGEVLVRMADGRCEIAWATCWHGSSNAFAQWTFRDPDEEETPVEWMLIPHGIKGGQQCAD